MKNRSILQHRLYLYLTEFFSGMAVMAVELGANRLLAPYFSSSQIVWTIIIGTIMIAMALGNIYGGRSADKDPDPGKLYRRILIAACWIAAIPVAGKYVIIAISGLLVIAIDTAFLIYAALISCLVIFVFPLFLLGTVTPSLVRYTARSLDESGRTVGNLGAFNTIGSIIGTFLPTFVTIPAVGTAVTFLLFSGVLLVLAFLYYIFEKKRKTGCIIALVFFILCCIFGSSDRFAFWEQDLTYEGESIYNYLQVKEDDRSVILSTNVLFGVQSIHMKEGGLTGLYYDYALAAPVMAGIGNENAAEAPTMLILGMGTGTYATQCAEYFPEIRTTGVEIDEKITNLAHTYFHLDEAVPVSTYDGRAYLAAETEKYDVIMVDAYRDITIPFQMSSEEFFRMVASHLKPGGVLIMNMNMYSEKEGTITDYLSDTVASVFPAVYTADVRGSTNRELYASMDTDILERFRAGRENVKDEALREFFSSLDERIVPYEAGNRILTDDKAPVELLGMEVIDEIITAELGYYREIYEEDGLKGLIDAF